MLQVYTGDPQSFGGLTLLGRLNTAYNILDLREGWRSERFNNTAQAALNHNSAVIS